MPLYKYRAVNKVGEVIEYRTEAPNRYALLNKLKENSMAPIFVKEINAKINKKVNKQKKNQIGKTRKEKKH